VQPGHPQRWRRFLKDAVAGAIWRTHPPSRRFNPAGTVKPLIVGYHRVVDDFDSAARTAMPTMLTGRTMFERHLDAIGRHFRFVGLDEIADRAARGVPFSHPVAAVTFDDGYRDVYEHAFPTLLRKGIPAAVFVVTDVVDRGGWQTHDRLYSLLARAYPTWDDPRRGLRCLLNDVGIPAADLMPSRHDTRNPYAAASALLPRLSERHVDDLFAGLQARVGAPGGEAPEPMTWEMVAALRRAGLTIGSHTRTHVWLATESPERTDREVRGSKEELERRLGEPVDHFAYPGGQFTPRVVDAVARAGYRFAYTACQHADSARPLLTLERLLLWEGSSTDANGCFSPAILGCQTHGLWPPARKCARTHAA
jgi:peptidoglycan/xylan/chitin deacetylase (PgdA/CDA1 family)